MILELRPLILPLCPKYLALRVIDSFQNQATYLVGGKKLTNTKHSPRLIYTTVSVGVGVRACMHVREREGRERVLG